MTTQRLVYIHFSFIVHSIIAKQKWRGTLTSAPSLFLYRIQSAYFLAFLPVATIQKHTYNNNMISCCKSLCIDIFNDINFLLIIVPDVPAFISVSRLSGSSAMIRWIPLTQTEVERFLIIKLEIAYEPIIDSATNCSSYNFTDSETVLIRENLLQQSTANITGLEPNQEYCIAIQFRTSEGESGFSNAIKIPCKMLIPFYNVYILYHDNMQCQEEPPFNLN